MHNFKKICKSAHGIIRQTFNPKVKLRISVKCWVISKSVFSMLNFTLITRVNLFLNPPNPSIKTGITCTVYLCFTLVVKQNV